MNKHTRSDILFCAILEGAVTIFFILLAVLCIAGGYPDGLPAIFLVLLCSAGFLYCDIQTLRKISAIETERSGKAGKSI